MSEYVFMMYVFIYCYKYCGSWSVLTLLTDTIKNSSKRVNLKGLTFAVLFCLFVFFNLPEVSDEDAMKKLEKRNDETTVSEARARYLQRKQQRQQSKPL